MRLLNRLAPDLFVIVLLLLLPLGFFSQQTLGGRTLIPAENLYQFEPYRTYREAVQAPAVPQNHLVSDLILENYQWKTFIRQQLAIGEIPLWNPQQFSGIPFLAAGQHSAFYPLSIIYYVLPLWLAYGWFTVVNLWLAGIFMYAFARALGIGRAGAALAGIIYQFSGFVLASVVFQMMIAALPWLPLMLLASEFILREKAFFGRHSAIPWVALGAIALGMNILAGHVEVTLYSLLMTAYFAGLRWLWQIWRNRRNRAKYAAPLRRAIWLALMLILGFGLASLQFIPLLEFVQTNWRAERSSYETVVGFAHKPRDILQFALPNFYGSPSHHQYLDVFSGEMVAAPWPVLNEDVGRAYHTEWGIKNYVEAALYPGILPLLLAAYALLDRFLLWYNRANVPDWMAEEPPYRSLFAVLGLFSLSFMFGLPTYRLIYALPGINQLNSPFRWIYALTVCTAILAAFGMDALMRRVGEKESPLEKRVAYGLFALGLMIFAGLALSYMAYPQLESFIGNLVNNMANARNAFSGPRMFYSYQFGNLAVLGVLLLLSGIVFWWIGRMRRHHGLRVWMLLVLAIVSVDLMLASWGFNPASDPALLDFTPPAVQWLQQQYDEENPFRYTTLEDPAQGAILLANSTMRYGLDDVRGYDSIIPKQYVDYMQGVAPQVQLDFNRVAPLYHAFINDGKRIDSGYEESLGSPQFNLLNIRYVLTPLNVSIPIESWDLAYEDEALRIWENPDAVPRAYLVAAENLPQGIIGGPLVDEAVRIKRDSGREKFMDVSLDSQAWLVISENYAPGWRAFLRPIGTGEEAEQALDVERVLGTFQGLQLPPGEWTLRLVYSPASFQVGFFGSAISIVSLTLLLGIGLWQTFVGANTETASQSAKVARNSIAPIILNLFNRSIDFVFAIVMLRLLDQESVGIFYFAIIIFVWFDIFTNFGLDLFLMREVSREKARSGYFFFNTSVLRLLLSLVGVPLLLGFVFIWQNGVEEPLTDAGLIALLVLYVGLFPASLSKGMTALFYAFEQAEKPAAIATITTINKAVLGVIVLLLGWGIIGLAAVSIVNNIITLLVLLISGHKLIGRITIWRPDFSLLRSMVDESWPLMLNHFLATIFFQIDIVILQALRGAMIVAQYSVSYRWLLAINIIPAFFTQALFPMMSRQAHENKEALWRSYRFGIKLMIALALPVAAAFTVLANLLTLILAGPTYLPNGAIALTIMIWSIPIGWMNSLTQYALVALDLQRWITRAFFVAVAFNILTNLVFIPQFGFRAAAVTTIFSELVLFIPFAWLMARGLERHVGWLGLLWRPIVATLAMLAVMLVFANIQIVLGLLVASGVYLVTLLSLRPLDEHEWAILRPLLPGRLQRMRCLQAARR